MWEPSPSLIMKERISFHLWHQCFLASMFLHVRVFLWWKYETYSNHTQWNTTWIFHLLSITPSFPYLNFYPLIIPVFVHLSASYHHFTDPSIFPYPAMSYLRQKESKNLPSSYTEESCSLCSALKKSTLDWRGVHSDLQGSWMLSLGSHQILELCAFVL